MNHKHTFLAFFLLFLTGNIAAAPTAPPNQTDAGDSPKQDVVQQTKALGQAVWEETKQSTKKARGAIKKKSKKYYKIAKDQAKKTATIVAEKSKSYYKTAKDTSQKYLEKATDTAKHLTSTVKNKANNYYESSKETIQETLDSNKKETSSTI